MEDPFTPLLFSPFLALAHTKKPPRYHREGYNIFKRNIKLF
jgi:hypothetical protein